jgi:hypothetical protein
MQNRPNEPATEVTTRASWQCTFLKPGSTPPGNAKWDTAAAGLTATRRCPAPRLGLHKSASFDVRRVRTPSRARIFRAGREPLIRISAVPPDSTDPPLAPTSPHTRTVIVAAHCMPAAVFGAHSCNGGRRVHIGTGDSGGSEAATATMAEGASGRKQTGPAFAAYRSDVARVG